MDLKNKPEVRKVTVRSLKVDCSESGYCEDLAAHFHITGEVVVNPCSVVAAMVRLDFWILVAPLTVPGVIVYPLPFVIGVLSPFVHDTVTAVVTSPILQTNV